MYHISSLLEGMLAVESDENAAESAEPAGPEESGKPELQGSGSDSLINNAINYRTFKNLYGDKWTGDMDFSSFWAGGKSDDTKSSGSKNPSSVLSDKIMEKMISMIIPMGVEGESSSRIIKDRIEMQKYRPSLSMNTMSTNSIQFNQRLSVVFYAIDNVIQLFNWTDPAFTIGMLLVVTQIILNPYLLTVLPTLVLMKSVFIPHYLEIYTPDNSSTSDIFEYNPVPSLTPVNTYKIPRPVPQLSREFILNLTDLQNHMVPYILIWDFFVWLTDDYLYFKNENITSIVFLGVLAITFNNFVVAPKIIPLLFRNILVLKLSAIFGIWLVTILFHPNHRGKILEWIYNEETRLNMLHVTNRVEKQIIKVLLDSKIKIKPEEKQVEIFELQKLNKETRIWEMVGFTNNFYTMNVASRKFNSSMGREEEKAQEAGQEYEESEGSSKYIKIFKKKCINDIKPPKNWQFSDSKWRLDLDVHQWVDDNLINDLGVIDDGEKWVYDFLEWKPIEKENEDSAEPDPKNHPEQGDPKGEIKEFEIKESETKESETKESEIKESETKDSERKEPENAPSKDLSQLKLHGFSGPTEGDIYRRRRWIRNCRRETNTEKDTNDKR